MLFRAFEAGPALAARTAVGSRDGLKRDKLARVGDMYEAREAEAGASLRLKTGVAAMGDVLRRFDGCADILCWC